MFDLQKSEVEQCHPYLCIVSSLQYSASAFCIWKKVRWAMSVADCNWGIGCVCMCIKNCNVVAVLWFVLCVWCTFYLAVLFADYMLDGLVCGAAADANALSIELLKSIGVGADWNHRCSKCCDMRLCLLICCYFVQCA